MEKIDLSKLNSINFGKKVVSEKKEEIKSTQDKQAEASALDAMSNYGKAAVNLTFKGKADEKSLSKDEKRETLKQLTTKSLSGNIKPLFDDKQIEELIKDDEVYKRVIVLSDIRGENGERLFDWYRIIDVANDEEKYKKTLELSNVKDSNGKMMFSAMDIDFIARDKEAYERVHFLLDIKDSEGKMMFSGSDITVIACSNETYKRALELLDIKDANGDIIFNGRDTADIVRNKNTVIDDRFKKRVIELVNIKDSDGEMVFDKYEIAGIAREENPIIDDRFKKRAIELANIKDSDGEMVFSHFDIESIAMQNIDIDDEFKKRAIELANIKDSKGNRMLDRLGIQDTINDKDRYDRITDYAAEAKENNLPLSPDIIKSIGYLKINKNQIKRLINIYGKEEIKILVHDDLVTMCNLSSLYKKEDINEISMSDKKELLRGLVSLNADSFELSHEFQKDFPLIPKNQEEYCALLPQLVKSLGIEVKEISDDKIKEFNSDIFNLSDSLKELSDDEFNNLEISQSYSREEFISDTIEVLGDLEDIEKQKVFDYFGFELKENKNNETGYTISGYPMNLNNGEKLYNIEDKKTKEVIEKLRPFVVQFAENNKIECSNSKVEAELNKIVEVLPEIRTMVGKSQHGTHSFDILKHSLKVMQKISQNPEFDKLNEDDKKLMLLSSLLHDITKGEGYVDKTHAKESAFDMYYIVKKLNLSRNDEIKLYTLSKNHEWLERVNKKDLSKDEIKERQKEVAFLLQQDNLFDMAGIFTEADLKSVKDDDRFFERFGSDFNKHSKEIREYISQLKKTQPILPTTKLPKSSEIKKHITKVNPDGSTNIKGVYQDKDGLIILKYNEIENWEELGLPAGTTSHGIKIPNTGIDTGNIKFIAHGLDYSNQLSKFDAFNLPDSDALLSVSYMERPESKYRLFRTQGVLLDVDSNFIYGGGETDSGSGYSKSISDFINNYAYPGAIRHGDRKFISNLIKKTLGLNNEEYIKFIQENKNKSFQEIEPKEVREKLIHAFGKINSKTRNGGREYNEMYVSNPKVMGVFAYPTNKNNEIGDIMEFVHEQEYCLKDYALDNDIPMVVFGE